MGNVIRNTEPHQKCSRSQPDTSGPSEAIAPPVPDHSAIDFVRAGPYHNAVIRARVVGKARPAETPPRMRAATRIPWSARKRRVGTRAPTSQRREPASTCARSGHRAHQDRAPTRRGRASTLRRQDRASSATHRTQRRSTAGPHWPRPSSGWRLPPLGSARRGRCAHAQDPPRIPVVLQRFAFQCVLPSLVGSGSSHWEHRHRQRYPFYP